MSRNVFDVRAKQPDLVLVTGRILGANGSVSKVTGKGWSIAYVSEGLYTITFKENNGTFLGWTYGLQATTPADVDGWTAVIGAYTTTTPSAPTIQISVYDATPTIADLVALNWLSFIFMFTANTGNMT